MLFCVKTPINKLYVFAMALLLAVTLVGCGGGGGGSTTTPVDPTPPTPPDCTPPQILNADMTACVDPPGPPPRDMAAPAMVMAKAMGIMALDPEVDDANTATVNEAKGFGDYALNADGTAYEAQTPFDGAANAANSYTVSVTWADGAAMTTVTDVGADGAAGATEDDTALMVSADMPQAIDGWAGSIHTPGMDSMEKVIVYTDIMAATPTPFTDVYTLNGNPATSGGDDFQSLLIVDANVGMLAGHGITSTGGGTTTLVAAVEDDPGTTDVDETVMAFETTAIFDGARGMLKCIGDTNCSATLNAAGEITAVTGTLAFTPAVGATAPVDDDDHLHFGFWVKQPAADEAYMIQTFAGGSDPYDTALTATQTDIEGKASYMGKAAGVYAQKTIFNAETGALEGGHVGAFTADVNLMAYFGTSADVAVNDQNTIRGAVSNFMDGENMIDESWTVELMRAKFDAATGMTTGNGAWTHSFFGPHQVSATDATAVMPSGVAGEFTGHLSNGHVAGAFGATKVME